VPRSLSMMLPDGGSGGQKTKSFSKGESRLTERQVLLGCFIFQRAEDRVKKIEKGVGVSVFPDGLFVVFLLKTKGGRWAANTGAHHQWRRCAFQY